MNRLRERIEIRSDRISNKVAMTIKSSAEYEYKL